MNRPPYVSQNWLSFIKNPDENEQLSELIAFWSVRSCGLACASSAIEFLTGKVVSQVSLFNKCIRMGGYSSNGWKHRELASTISDFGIQARSQPMTMTDVRNLLSENYLIIVSVTHKFPVDGRKGGHLVLIYSIGEIDGEECIFFMDPSGWGKDNTFVTLDRFSKSYSMKGISLKGVD